MSSAQSFVFLSVLIVLGCMSCTGRESYRYCYHRFVKPWIRFCPERCVDLASDILDERGTREIIAYKESRPERNSSWDPALTYLGECCYRTSCPLTTLCGVCCDPDGCKVNFYGKT